MQTITSDQTPLTPAIGALARQVKSMQDDAAALGTARFKAEGLAGRCVAAYNLDRQQLSNSAAIAASRQRYEDAQRSFLEVCARQSQVEQELHEMNAHLQGLAVSYRLTRALGGRALTVPALPTPLANDSKMAALAEQARDVAGKRETAKARAVTATGDLDAAETRLARARADVHLGKAKRGDVTEAERAIVTLRETCDLLDQDVLDLDAAAGSVQADIRAREDALVAAWLPAVTAEYKVRVQAFADALRLAAQAAENLRPAYVALSGVTVATSEPWNELLISDQNSKARFWLDRALEAGEIT